MNTGQVCNIHRMIELKHKYKLRLFIDESVSFGSIGQHGKGITEHKNISVIFFIALNLLLMGLFSVYKKLQKQYNV